MKFKVPTAKPSAALSNVVVKSINPSNTVVGGVDITFAKTAEFKAPEYRVTLTAEEIKTIAALI